MLLIPKTKALTVDPISPRQEVLTSTQLMGVVFSFLDENGVGKCSIGSKKCNEHAVICFQLRFSTDHKSFIFFKLRSYRVNRLEESLFCLKLDEDRKPSGLLGNRKVSVISLREPLYDSEPQINCINLRLKEIDHFVSFIFKLNLPDPTSTSLPRNYSQEGLKAISEQIWSIKKLILRFQLKLQEFQAQDATLEKRRDQQESAKQTSSVFDNLLKSGAFNELRVLRSNGSDDHKGDEEQEPPHRQQMTNFQQLFFGGSGFGAGIRLF
ncbi:MAG: hypothetical protein H0W88_03805 [Parachlamydiaceae bacterium]|nr:hypothetical protein [Parachlamydiaceae bacterium]